MQKRLKNKAFWNDQRVLVTGGAGFLGSFVVEQLEAHEPAKIIVPRSRHYDLRNWDATQKLFKETQPTIVIHLAALCGGIGANQAQPGRYFYDNAIMGIQLMEVARQFGVSKFVQVGTVCAYPKVIPTPFHENDLWNGYPEETNAPYGLAKKMLLVQAQAYRQQYGFNAIYLLPANLYGPRDNFDLEKSHVIPALIRKVLTARAEGLSSIEVWGTGKPTREFLYVEDAAAGILQATEHFNGADPVNLGTGRSTAIHELVTEICKQAQFNGEIVWNTTKPDGQPERRLDTSRAKQEFGFEAATSLEAGLRKTIEWFRSTQQQHEASLALKA